MKNKIKKEARRLYMLGHDDAMDLFLPDWRNGLYSTDYENHYDSDSDS